MISLIPMGKVDETSLEALRQGLARVLSQRSQIGDIIELPQERWHQHRGQHLASLLLARLPSPASSGDRVLGVVDVDIFAPGLNFVFGEADIAGKRGLISLKRLRQEFYGLPQDENLFRQRALKEAVHELGHTYGLGHCPDAACVMHFSNSLHDTDVKGWNFCPSCRKKMTEKNRWAL